MSQRDYRMDNIRFVLICFVVFGHLLELHSGFRTEQLYRFIYTIHMPAFIFVTGYFASFNPRRITLSLIYPYFLFQTLYQAFDAFVIEGEASVVFSYTTPYWLLWYLLATIFYHFLIPMLEVGKGSTKIGIFVFSIVISLLSGYDPTVSYYLSLSRVLNFLPFFIAGYFVGHCGNCTQGIWVGNRKKKILFAICLIFLIAAERLIMNRPESFSNGVLYGSFGYAEMGHNWKHRALLMAVGFAWIVLLLFAVSPKRISFISSLGKNAMPVFLFHGFLIRLFEKHAVFCYTESKNLLLSVIITVGIVFLLGNPVSAWICKWVFTGHWITALAQKWQKRNSLEIK